MKTVAIHSHKGGVGKTTAALLFAKYAAERGKKVCVIDFDFIGSGIANLIALHEGPRKYVEEYFLCADPHDFDLDALLGTYKDPGKGGKEFSVILNLGRGLPKGRAARDQKRTDENMMALVANEPHYGEVEMKADILLRRLAGEKEIDLAIVDCHPGLGLASGAMSRLADLNVYVATPNRSDCFGLLKGMNLRKLDSRKSLLLLNMAVEPVTSLQTLRSEMEGDALVGTDAKALFPALKHVGQKEEHFAVIPDGHRLRTLFHLGGPGTLPKIDGNDEAFSFCPKLSSLVG